MKGTIVIDMADRDAIGAAISTIRKHSCVVACCDGDAMDERDTALELLKRAPFGFHTDMPDREECHCSRCDWLREAKELTK